DGVARVDLRELVDHHDVREVVHAAPTQLLRPRNAEQAEVGHLSHVVPGELTRQVVAAGARLHDLLREVAHHVAHLEMKVGEVEGVVHAGNIVARYTLHVAREPRTRAPWNVCRGTCNAFYPVVPNPAAMQLMDKSRAASSSSGGFSAAVARWRRSSSICWRFTWFSVGKRFASRWRN